MNNSNEVILKGTFEQISEQLTSIIADKTERELFINLYVNGFKQGDLFFREELKEGLKEKSRYYLKSEIRFLQRVSIDNRVNPMKYGFFVSKSKADRSRAKLKRSKIAKYITSQENVKIPTRIIGTRTYYFKVSTVIFVLAALLLDIHLSAMISIAAFLDSMNNIKEKWNEETGEKCVVDFIKEYKRLPNLKDFSEECCKSYDCTRRGDDSRCNIGNALKNVVLKLYDKKLLIVKLNDD